MLTPAQIAAIAVKALDDKKAKDIKVLKTDGQTVLADYFVICNGTSAPHIKSLVDEVDRQLSEAGEPLIRRTRRANSTIWSASGAMPRQLTPHPFRAPDYRGVRSFPPA